jgi:hypothetical protein
VDTGSPEANASDKETEPSFDSIETERLQVDYRVAWSFADGDRLSFKKRGGQRARSRRRRAPLGAVAQVPRPLRACRAADLHRDLDFEAPRHRDLDQRSSWTISAIKTPKPYACPFAPLALIILSRTLCRNDLRFLDHRHCITAGDAQIILKFLGYA